MLDTLKENALIFTLVIIIMVSAATLPDRKGYDSMTTFKKIRKLFIGCVGSSLAVLCVYYTLIWWGCPQNVSLAFGGAVGFAGGETATRLFARYITNKITKN